MKKRMVKPFEMEDRTKRILILVIIIIGVVITAYFNFFSYEKCDDWICFNTNLAKCKKATFINAQEDSTWSYSIKGLNKGNCVVHVRNLYINIEEAGDVEGKEMLCSLPRGLVVSPESNIDACHGLLKDAMQDIIIKKLHVYIVQNIGQIKESITTPL